MLRHPTNPTFSNYYGKFLESRKKDLFSRLVSGIVRPFTLFPIRLNFSSLVLSRFNDHLDGVIQLFGKSFQGIPEFLQREVMRDHGLDFYGPIIN